MNGVEEWFARFELLVPPSGPSEERTIGVLAAAGPLHLDVTVTVDMRPYRDFTISVDAGGAEHRADRRYVDEQGAARVPGRRRAGRPRARPRARTGRVAPLARVGERSYDTRVGWPSEAQLANLVRNVRGAADRWRASASASSTTSTLPTSTPPSPNRCPISWRDDPGPCRPNTPSGGRPRPAHRRCASWPATGGRCTTCCSRSARRRAR